MPETCGPDDCQQPGYCDGYNCSESGKVRPFWGNHFNCVYPLCDCPMAVMGADGPLPVAMCPSPCNPLCAGPREWAMPVVSERVCE